MECGTHLSSASPAAAAAPRALEQAGVQRLSGASGGANSPWLDICS